jgi:hypothetical protein
MRIAFAAFVAAGAIVSAADVRDRAFTLGILRRDSVVVPFASFDGRNWSSRWPQPALDLTIPIDVRSVPSRWWGPTGPIDTWQAWVGAREPRMVHVIQPDWIDVHCVRQIGLRTDYRPDQLPAPRTEQPYPKDGLVVAPPHPIERVDVIPVRTLPPSAEVTAISAELLEAFNVAERTTARKYSHPAEASLRERVEPTVDALYAYGSEPRVYYVEAVRQYQIITSGDCVGMAFGTGWLVRENGKFRTLAMAVDLLDCTRAGASYMLPLGVVRSGTRLFWIVQFSGFDHERYVVIEPRAKRVDAVLSVWGGGC